MNKVMLDLYTDYLISSNHYRTATGMSDALCGEISHDKVTRFLSKMDYDSKALWLAVKPSVRAVEDDNGVLIFDDTIEEKPHTDENEIMCWHFDHSCGRNVKGMNILSAIACYGDVSLPISFEIVRKERTFTDIATRKVKRVSDRTKNEMFRDMIKTSVANKVKYRHVLADIWYGSKDNMVYVRSQDKHFIFAVKGNRTVALSMNDKLCGDFSKVESLSFEEDEAKEVYIKGLDFPVLLTKQVFTNKDGSTGILYLVTSDLSLDAPRIKEIYQKRWKIEEYHKSIKSNIGLEKSPTRTVRTQANHVFATICAFIKLETLKIKTNMNHFALKYKLIVTANIAAMKELNIMKNMQTA